MASRPAIPATAPAGARIVRSFEAHDGAHDYALAVKVGYDNAAAVAEHIGGTLMHSVEVSTNWTEAVIHLSTGDQAREGDWVLLDGDPKVVPSREINRRWRGVRGGVLAGR